LLFMSSRVDFYELKEKIVVWHPAMTFYWSAARISWPWQQNFYRRR
jgi:hypothetical protein